jgi:hypothetical protein
MSLFLPKHNAIFLHIPKCAGQSIEKALGYKHHHRHHKVNDLPDDLENYFRFPFARHPVRRFISACNYNLRVATATRKKLELADSKSLSPSKEYRLHLITSNANYDSIIDDLTDGKLKKIPFFKHQKHWLKKGKPQFIGRVENIDTDFAILSKILRIKSKLKRTNKSPDTASLGKFSKKNFREVVEYYKEDFNVTGYSPKHSDF